MIKNSCILITGGTGSLGKSLINFLLQHEEYRPKTIKILSRDENKHYSLSHQYKNTRYGDSLQYIIGDVRSLPSIISALQDVDIVIHAAAMKQVPICENFPYEAVQTNIVGANNIVCAIEQYKLPIKKVIGISTDKACEPMNVYGMTKFIQEKVFFMANSLVKTTDFVSVRYGNVLGSTGSVIPLFQTQIKNGNPLTVTNKHMTRFFCSPKDVIDTIIAAIYQANREEILVPKIQSFSIMNIATVMSQNLKIPIVISGIRPGEKIHETLISEYEIHKTQNRTINNKPYYVINVNSDNRYDDLIIKPHTSADIISNLDETYNMLKVNNFLS